MPTIFQPPRAFIPNASGVKYPGAKAYFFQTGTTTPKNSYTDFALSVAHAHPVVADANGDWPTIYLSNDARYRVTIKQSDGTLIYTQDDVGGPVLTQQEWGTIGYPRTDAETSAGVTPTNYYGSSRPWTDAVARYGLNGDGTTDNTAAFTAMMSIAGQSLFIKRGDYVTGKFDVPSNTTLYLEPGTIIRDSGALGVNDRFINITQKTNVHIIGWGAEVTMDRADYVSGEQRHGVFITGSDDICVEGLASNDSGGDGFYVGNVNGTSDNPTHIRLLHCKSDNNRRQGLSITGGIDVLVEGGYYSNTTGTAPQAGIDIEPDSSDCELQAIRIIDVTTAGNAGGGILCALSNFVLTASKWCDIEIRNHTSIGDGTTAQRGAFSCVANTAANWANRLYGRVSYIGGKIKSPGMSGIVCMYWDADRAPRTVVQNTTVHNCGGSATNSRDKCGATLFAGTGTTMSACGNFEIYGLEVTDDRGTPLTYTGYYIENSSALVKKWVAQDVECIGFTPTVAANRDITVLQGSYSLSDGRASSTRNRSVTITGNSSAIDYMGRDAIIAGGSLVLTLPDAQYCLGQEFKCVNGGAYTFQLRAPASNQIYYNGIAAAGDLNLFKQGDVAVLRATAAGTWTVESLVRGTRTGTAAPSANATFIGEFFVDTTNSKTYCSKAIGGGAADWMLLN